MSSSDRNSRHQPRWLAAGEWLLVIGLALTLAWTTLCLGGYLADTMVITSGAVLALGTWGAVLWAAGRRELHLAVLLPVPFLIYALGSVLWLAPAKWLAWREWLLWFQMWLVFALTLHFGRSRAQTWTLVGTFGLLGLAGTGMAAWQRFVDPSWMMLGREQADQFVGRSAGMFGIPNSLAGLLELMVPVCLVLLFSRAVRPAGKIACGWLAALFIFAVVLTGSRGGWIGLGLALLVWPLLTGRDWRKKILGTVAVLACAAAGLWALYQGSDYARARIDPFLEGKFESSRPIIWKAGWQMWRDDPWLGRGAAAYNVLFDQYRPRGFLNEPDWTHNDHLNTLIDYGVAGFVLWVALGLALAWVGWGAVCRARRETVTTDNLFALAKWKLGLLLGLLAYVIHLGVDFHTKIPALAFAAAIVAAVLVRDEPTWWRPVRPWVARLSGSALVLGVAWIAASVAAPLYRAEGIREAARRQIERHARTGEGDIGEIATAARSALRRAVRVDPENGQAWADLSYATVQSWPAGKTDLVTLGRFAELAADEALRRCAVDAEFWVRRAVALDIQRGRSETESCYRRALELAPHSASWWYHYAYHLQAFPQRRTEARVALETCLALDPSHGPANILRQQLNARR
ncbi:O-antigen ligase family protein [Oleiharenicola lentus]|uniref:O-antigen ligase family protein n=1 Tax=Oleiharenicola lentus TaxID=2508720 RepID=A0A4Q1C9M7_9BACT|nr:O-antigen ligase family protein [Oleiharenicola lentus]RXK55668.1 O-antigen ligase family protein [Oleiharenicola lentus]